MYICISIYIYILPAPLCLPLPRPLPVLMIEIDEQAALLPLPLWIRMVMDVFLKPRPRYLGSILETSHQLPATVVVLVETKFLRMNMLQPMQVVVVPEPMLYLHVDISVTHV